MLHKEIFVKVFFLYYILLKVIKALEALSAVVFKPYMQN